MDEWKVKQLCDDIEKTCRPRDEINLAYLCNKHPNIYGEKASEDRRHVQKKFDLLKRKTIKQYALFLDSLEVPYGASTLRELRRIALIEDSSTAANNSSTAANNDDGNETDSSNDNTAPEPDLETIVENFSIASYQPTEPPIVAATPERPLAATPLAATPLAATPLAATPVRRLLRPTTFVGFSPNNNKNIMLSSPSPSVTHSMTNSEQISETFPGSRNSPHVIEVDIAYPERNREFFVQHVNNLEHNQHVRSGFHIRRTTAVQDRDLWEAKIHDGQSRSILIKGPSRDWWLTQPDLYGSQFKCDATKKAHAATGLAIGRDETRQWTYWLLIFPESIVLENVIFSGDPVEIDTHVIGMATTLEGMNLQNCVVYWQVSEKFGGRRIKENTKSSIKNLFSP
jgi:hypothetical protein